MVAQISFGYCCTQDISRDNHTASREKIDLDEPILETRLAVGDTLKTVEEHEMFSRLKFAIERNSIELVGRIARPLNMLPAIPRHAIHSGGRVLPRGPRILACSPHLVPVCEFAVKMRC
ncbi:hypothetical protein [Caballeronia arvi]|uniref:hypothetical protein n=1 Tax=Caballeronia arvi TaxID=1777135 RepID=UPI00117F6523|nr:hypothetical protein [Caballeronia arvi]